MVLKSTCPSWESAWNILLLFLSYNLKLRLEMEPVFVYQKYYSVAPDFLRKKPGEKSTCWSVFGEKLAILGIILAKSWRFGAETGEKLAIFKGKIFSFGSNFGDFRGKNWRNSTSTFWQHCVFSSRQLQRNCQRKGWRKAGEGRQQVAKASRFFLVKTKTTREKLEEARRRP